MYFLHVLRLIDQIGIALGGYDRLKKARIALFIHVLYTKLHRLILFLLFFAGLLIVALRLRDTLFLPGHILLQGVKLYQKADQSGIDIRSLGFHCLLLPLQIINAVRCCHYRSCN